MIRDKPSSCIIRVVDPEGKVADDHASYPVIAVSAIAMQIQQDDGVKDRRESIWGCIVRLHSALSLL